MSKARANQLVRAAAGSAQGDDDAERIEPQPVVAAIVTSGLGVLIARRNDGSPPWTFIAGEIEPGESPADAAVREVKEETGCDIQAGPLIGRRVHPATGRTMIYMSADVTGSTAVHVGDEDELAEVRWASLPEADELMPGMFPPVRAHLAAALRDDARANQLVRAAGASGDDPGPAHGDDGKSAAQITNRDDAAPQGGLHQRKAPGSAPDRGA